MVRDYDLNRTLAQQVAAGQVREAERISLILETAPLGPTRAVILDAMRIFERDVLKDVTWHP
jgi:hypothetical protein